MSINENHEGVAFLTWSEEVRDHTRSTFDGSDQADEQNQALDRDRDRDQLDPAWRVRRFIEKYPTYFSDKHFRKGQSIQCMTALDELGGRATLDQIIQKIIDDRMWFNPSIKKNGWGTTGRGSRKYCNGLKPYKMKRQSVMDMTVEEQTKAIKNILLFNVLNTQNYNITSTRKTESSVLQSVWGINGDFQPVTLDDGFYELVIGQPRE